MRRVLVVDDEENLRLVLRTMLRGHGYEVETASNALDALAKVDSFQPDFVLTDVRMDGLDGIQLCARLRDHPSGIVVIVMSAYGSIDLAIEAIHAGAYDYISKPFKRDEVLLTLRKAVEREQLRRENRALRARLERAAPRLLGRSAAIERVRHFVQRAADAASTVLLRGESGTGKELVARSLHASSQRGSGPFLALACGAIPEATLESELFGHRRGAFSGAIGERIGLFEAARGGTLLLDEVADLTPNIQAKLLRVLQENVIRRLGETSERSVDVRIVASSRCDLEAMVRAGEFREDLFYRLNVLSIEIAPLRERMEDLPLLIEHFLSEQSSRVRRAAPRLNPEVEQALAGYAWPGNVRELENVLERAMLLGEGQTIGLADLPDALRAEPSVAPASELSIKRRTRLLEEELIRRALAETSGNRTAAARILEISHRALLYKIRDFGID